MMMEQFLIPQNKRRQIGENQPYGGNEDRR
jgi:hypothetical protein